MAYGHHTQTRMGKWLAACHQSICSKHFNQSIKKQNAKRQTIKGERGGVAGQGRNSEKRIALFTWEKRRVALRTRTRCRCECQFYCQACSAS